MLFHKGFYDVQHWREVQIICLCMTDLVKNLRNNGYIRSKCCEEQHYSHEVASL